MSPKLRLAFSPLALIAAVSACADTAPLDPALDPGGPLLAEVSAEISGTFSDVVAQDASIGAYPVYCGGAGQQSCTARGFPTPPDVQGRWGYPADPNRGQKSGLGFQGADGDLESNRDFLIGTLTHFNFPIVGGSAASAITLTFDLALGDGGGSPASFPVRFEVDETPNAGSCAYPSDTPCADRITWSLPEPRAIEVDGTVYALNIKGFRESASSTSPALDGFVSQEGRANSAYLFAELVDATAQTHAVDDAYAFPVGEALEVAAPGLLANDAGVVSASLAVAPAHGTVDVDADGGFVYSPAAGFAGEDSFVYFGRRANGELSLAVVTLRALDTSPPVIAPLADRVAEAAGPEGAVVSWPEPAGEDAVDGSVPVACAPASGSVFPLGPTTVACTASDAAGNEAAVTFTVTVEDTTPPELTLPADLELRSLDSRGAVATFEAAASDRVDGPLAVACEPASGSLFAAGATTVGCTAADAAGNTASGTFVVTVVTAEALLDGLVERSTGVGAGKSLAQLADNARAAFLRGDRIPSCGQLGAFLNAVDAQRGKQLPAERAAELRALASELRGLLGC